MKNVFKSKPFKVLCAIIAVLMCGAVVAALNGSGATAQSTVVGTLFAPCHYIANGIAKGVDKVAGTIKGDEQYEKEITSLQNQVGELQDKLVDYENLKRQNELYKEFLELKDEHKEYKFAEASVIGRDSADVYKSFTISKGMVNGVKVGDAVLYGKYLVGVVDKAYPDYAVVKTILSPEFNISAYEIITGEMSYVTGTAALAKENKCKLANLDASTKISNESIICTAGVGGTMPKNLIIGTVDRISDETTDISSYAVINPGVDIEKITSCFVLTKF